MRIKICRKEAKESRYWLQLIETNGGEKDCLIKEASELTNIFGAIIRNAK
jgi:four helix bundle protein